MSSEKYDIGDTVILTASFTDRDGTAVAPTGVTCLVKQPDGTVEDYIFGTDAEITNPAVGEYETAVPITQAGKHLFRYEGTGSNNAAEEGFFLVRSQQVAIT